MQTFLPYPDFDKTAQTLDKKRLFKQLVESRQILATIGEKVTKNDGGLYKKTHIHHPIHKMWKDHRSCLKLYHNALLRECLNRNIKTPIQPLIVTGKITVPDFIGDPEFHAAQRSNLLRKDRKYYSQFGWKEQDNLPYIW